MPINVPNTLTIIRILLAPLFVIFLLKKMFVASLLVIAFAGASDGMDGLLARWLNQRTLLGAYLDPIADKLLLLSAFICLAIIKIVPAWLTVIVLTRDVIILLGVAVISIFGIKVRIKPSIVSKCTTLVQIITVIFTLLDLTLLAAPAVLNVLFWATAAFTAASGLHYIFVGMNILQNALADEAQNQR